MRRKPKTLQPLPAMMRRPLPKLLPQNQQQQWIQWRRDARLNWPSLRKLKPLKPVDAPKKRAVIQNMWRAVRGQLLTGTVQIFIERDRKARHQLMWHHVAAAKLMRWHRVAPHRAAKVLVVANLEK